MAARKNDADHGAMPRIVDEVIVYSDPFTRIRLVTHMMPSGRTAQFYIRDEADVAVCLPITEDGAIVLLEEYRPGPGQFLLEIPGGSVGPGEDPEIAARREVLEETGYAGNVVHIVTAHMSGYSSQRKHIFVMEKARKITEPINEPNQLSRVVEVSQSELLGLVEKGDLTDLDAALAGLRYMAISGTFKRPSTQSGSSTV